MWGLPTIPENLHPTARITRIYCRLKEWLWVSIILDKVFWFKSCGRFLYKLLQCSCAALLSLRANDTIKRNDIDHWRVIHPNSSSCFLGSPFVLSSLIDLVLHGYFLGYRLLEGKYLVYSMIECIMLLKHPVISSTLHQIIMAAEIHKPGFFCLSWIAQKSDPGRSFPLDKFVGSCGMLTMILSLNVGLVIDLNVRTKSPREAQWYWCFSR